MSPTEMADEYESIAEAYEVDSETVEQLHEMKVQELSDRFEGERLQSLALKQARQAINQQQRIPSDHVELLTIGGSVQNRRNGDTFVGTALVDQNPNEDRGRNMIAEIAINEKYDAMAPMHQAFDEVGNIVRGEFAVFDADRDGFLSLRATDATEIEVERPENREPMISDIQDAVPSTTIQDIPDNMSSQSRGDNGELYTDTFDVRRIEGTVYDCFKNPGEGYGSYTVRDETVFADEDVIEAGLHDPENANENAVPGLTCWADPRDVEYGSGSICEFYGTLSTDKHGIPIMNVHGVVPIVVEDFDGYEMQEDDSPDPQEETQADRTVIG